MNTGIASEYCSTLARDLMVPDTIRKWTHYRNGPGLFSMTGEYENATPSDVELAQTIVGMSFDEALSSGVNLQDIMRCLLRGLLTMKHNKPQAPIDSIFARIIHPNVETIFSVNACVEYVRNSKDFPLRMIDHPMMHNGNPLNSLLRQVLSFGPRKVHKRAAARSALPSEVWDPIENIYKRGVRRPFKTYTNSVWDPMLGRWSTPVAALRTQD